MGRGSRRKERTIAVRDANVEQIDDEALLCGVSDDELEMAAGTSAGEQGGSSLWSSYSVSGCTCVSG